MSKKINCRICGGTGYNAAHSQTQGEIRSPCGGCNGTGYQRVETTSSGNAQKGGCMIFLVPLILAAIGVAGLPLFGSPTAPKPDSEQAQSQIADEIPFTDLRGKDYTLEKISGFAKGLSNRGDTIIFLYIDNENIPRERDVTLREIEEAARQLKSEGYPFFEVWAASSESGKRHLEFFIDGYTPPGSNDPRGSEYGGLTLSITRYVKEQYAWQRQAKAKAERKRKEAKASG